MPRFDSTFKPTRGAFPFVVAALAVACGVDSAWAGGARYKHEATLDRSTGDVAASLVVGSDGNMYDVNMYGGDEDLGTIMRVGLDGTVTVLHSFTRDETVDPEPTLVALPDGSLWGVSALAGDVTGNVFRFDPATGVLTVVHTFCLNQPDKCLDGQNPYARLVLAPDGMLYGTTNSGGTCTDIDSGCGTIFRIDPATLEFTSVYSFSKSAGHMGNFPFFGLTTGPDGRLYGAVSRGWGHQNVVYAFDPATLKAQKLYTMKNRESFDGEFMLNPEDGQLYGVTRNPDKRGLPGHVVAVSTAGAFRVVHAFEGRQGAYPYGGVRLASDGFLYGNAAARSTKSKDIGHEVAYRVRPTGADFSIVLGYGDGDAHRGAFLQVGDDLWDTAQYTIFKISHAVNQ